MRYSTAIDGSTGLVRLSDENAGLQASVAPARGAELSSLRYRFQGDWVETLYRANEFTEPDHGWRGRAPALWPAVGRNFTEEHLQELQRTGDYDGICTYVQDEKTWEIPRHGFAMHMPWELQSHTADSSGATVVCALGSNEETRGQYPFDFDLSVRFLLADGVLRMTYRIDSHSHGLPFSIGNHLSFRLPFGRGGRFEDVLIWGPIEKQQETTEAGLFSGRELELDLCRGARLGWERLHNGVFGPVPPDHACVELWQEGAFGFRVSQRALDPTDARLYFVFYAQPLDGLFCPEPWLGGPNSLNTREGVVTLAAGESFSWEMTIEPLPEAGELSFDPADVPS